MSDDRPWCVGTCVVAIRPDRKFLLGLRADTGLWALPGGAMDPTDECPEECALRELMEETGIQGMHVWPLGWACHEAKGKRWVGLYLAATVPDEAQARNIEPDKHHAWEWFDLEGFKREFSLTPDKFWELAKIGVDLAENQGMFSDDIF